MLCRHRRQDGIISTMALKHLVVVLPGIGGSVLETDTSDTLWDAGLPSILRLIRKPERLSLAETPLVRATGLINSTQVLPGWTAVHGYEDLITSLRRIPGAALDAGHPDQKDLAADVVLFPYDFRQSIRETAVRLADEIRNRLEHAGASAGHRRVIVVAHSMGGLVARYWLGPLGGWKVCRTAITLGTPHRGAPKALNLLVNGVRIGPVRFAGTSQLFLEWPSVGELLPRYRAVWDVRESRALYPHELPIAELKSVASRGFAIHNDIETAWDGMPRSGTAMLPRMGFSHKTPSSARWDGKRLAVTSDYPSWLPAGQWQNDDGDGTVPAYSAVPVEMDNESPVNMRVRERHGPLGSAAFVSDLILQLERWDSLSAVRGGNDRPAALGLTLEETHFVGQPVAVSVTVPRRGRAAAVWATLRSSETGRPISDVLLDDDGDRYVGEFMVADAGTYEVTITARSVPGLGDLRVSDSFVALAL